jgi:hypothetical protein
LTQVIGMYAGPIPLVLELRGKCIWQDPEKEEGLLAALAIVVDQTKWYSNFCLSLTQNKYYWLFLWSGFWRRSKWLILKRDRKCSFLQSQESSRRCPPSNAA